MISSKDFLNNEPLESNTTVPNVLTSATFCVSRDDLMLDEAKRTVPIGVEILENKLNKTSIKLKYGKLSIIIFRMYVPKEKEASLRAWLLDYEKKFDVQVIIQREQDYSGIKSLFNKHFKNTTLLTKEDRDTLIKIRDQFFGTPQEVTKEYIESRKKFNSKLISLSHIPFVAIDDAGTLDPEDAMYVEQISDNLYHLTVAIADISYLIEPRGKQKDFAINLGTTIYGSKTRISTLGNLINFPESCLSESELTPAWVFNFEINKGEKVKLLKEPFLAKVRVHKKITPEEFSSNTCSDIKQVRALAEVARAIRLQRTNNFDSLENITRINESGEPSFDANEVVSEIIIKTKETFAKFLSKHKPKKAIFKVQRTLSLNKKREILRDLDEIGFEPTKDIFKYPQLLSKVFAFLQTFSFDAMIYNDQEMLKAQKVLNDIINVVFKRSYYDNSNKGHAFLNVSSYCDIKGRLAAGIINQIQARNIIQGYDKSYSISEIQKMVKKLNRQIRTYGIKYYTLHFLEMLYQKLDLIDKSFIGTIKRIKDNNIYVEIDEFKKWGILHKNNIPLLKNSKIDDKLNIKLKGYLLKEERFLFEIK